MWEAMVHSQWYLFKSSKYEASEMVLNTTKNGNACIPSKCLTLESWMLEALKVNCGTFDPTKRETCRMVIKQNKNRNTCIQKPT